MPSMKVSAPKKDDREDVRCAFAVHGCATPNDVDEDEWCAGCGFYVCAGCDTADGTPLGKHDVIEHQALDEEIEDMANNY